MTHKKPGFFFLLLAVGITLYAQGRPTSNEELIKTGISFYSEGKYSEAVSILSLAGSSPESLYWLSLAELSAGNFNKSLVQLEKLEKADPGGRWSAEAPYHRGRCFYYLGRNEEALASLKGFTEKLPNSDPRKAAAFYWQGESLLALGQLDTAADAFSFVVENYPESAKYEASYYRLNLINQKKIEAELLALLKWSHEESLKSMDEYQEREKNYELAISSYQKRLGELLEASGETAVLSSASSEYYQTRLNAAEKRIAELEAGLSITNMDPSERNQKLLELKAAATELTHILNTKLSEVEN